MRVGSTHVIAIRPDGFEIGGAADVGVNRFRATTLRETFLGSHNEYLLDIGGHRLKADSSADLVVGQSCQVRIDPAKIVILPA